MEKIPNNAQQAEFINLISGQMRGTNYIFRKEVKIRETINFVHEQVVHVSDENYIYDGKMCVYVTTRGDLKRARREYEGENRGPPPNMHNRGYTRGRGFVSATIDIFLLGQYKK